MATIFLILAFMTAVGVSIPMVNNVSPFQAHPNDVQNPAANAKFWNQPAGCTSPGNTLTCNASLATGNTNAGIFGPVVNTILVFGNFFAAASFLVNIAVGVIVPGAYVLTWAGGPQNPTAVALSALYQGLVWVLYALDFFYIVSGRWLKG